MKDRTKFALATVVLTTIALSFVAAGTIFLSRGIASLAVVCLTVAVTLSILFAVLLKRVHTDIKTEMPSEDEREKMVRTRAAGHTYFISLCLWLVIMFIRNYLTKEQIIGTGISGMAIIFVILWWYLNRKGDTT